MLPAMACSACPGTIPAYTSTSCPPGNLGWRGQQPLHPSGAAWTGHSRAARWPVRSTL